MESRSRRFYAIAASRKTLPLPGSRILPRNPLETVMTGSETEQLLRLQTEVLEAVAQGEALPAI